MRSVRAGVEICVLLACALWVNAQAKPIVPSGMTLVTSVEGVTEYRLDNGLRVLMLADSSKPTVTVNITYLVGSRFESYGETGMAHLLEHLMFKGTPKHPNVPDELSKHGADPNGTTNDDRTNYFETFAATDENLDWALDLEADRMVNSYIAKKDLDSEMTVVRNEFERGENSPVAVLNERVLETAYLWHNYGHPTIGARSDIERVPIERLQAFYHKYYQPDNAILILAGKLDESKTLALIQQKFGKIAKPTRVLSEPYTEEPTQDGEREVVLRRVGDMQVVMAAYHVPAAGHPDAIALDLLCNILSDEATGRLRKRLIDTKLATQANASMNQTHDPGTVLFLAITPKDTDIEKLKTEMIDIAQGVAKEPVSQEELDRAKARSLEQLEKMLADPSYVAFMLSESAAMGDWRLLFWDRDQMKKLTLADLQNAASRYLIASNLTIGEFIPVDKPIRAAIPATPDYASVLKGYTGQSVVSAGEQFVATPANIEARTSRTTIGMVKAAFLPKKTRAAQVNATLRIHFGTEKALMNRKEAGVFAASLLMRGTAKHDMQQLRDALTAIKTEMEVRGDATGVTVTLVSDRDHLDGALRLAAEVLQQPTFPEKEFDELKRNQLTQLESRKSEPQAIAFRALQRAMSPYPKEHVNYVPTLQEQIEQINALTVQDVKDFYHDFYGIGAAEIGIVGDFDVKTAEAAISESLANWKSPAPYARVPKLYKALTGGTLSFDTPDKANAVFLVGSNLEIRSDDPAYPALVMGNYMLGGGFLNSRLAVRIRQKEGLSYGVGSDLQASALDRVGTFMASAISAPQNHRKVQKAFGEELDKVLADGFSCEELAAAKSGYLQSEEVDRSDDGNLASQFAEHLFDGRTFQWDEQFDVGVKSLTREQVGMAMKKYIVPNQLVIVGAGDFSKGAS
jgi:zinc protease